MAKLKVEIRETVTLQNNNKYDAYNRFTLDGINHIDKRYCYYIPSMNILKDFNDFLNLDFELYKKKN